MWNPSYTSDYFSLSDILATEERVPLVTKIEMPQLGFLDQSSPNMNLAPGTKLELPFWMVWALRGRGRIDLQLPKSWNASQRAIISADPDVLDLHKLGPHFYESGRHMMQLVGTTNESDEIGKILVDTFIRRFRSIMDTSQNSDECEALYKTERLDALEKGLYEQGQLSMKLTDSWTKRKTGQIKTSIMVQRHRKRKADSIE